MSVELFGQVSSEKIAEENQTCREIVRTVSEFGVNNRQRLMLMYLLALELDNVEQMQEITAFFKDFVGSEIFLTDKYEKES
jgi:hypothetical protein